MATSDDITSEFKLTSPPMISKEEKKRKAGERAKAWYYAHRDDPQFKAAQKAYRENPKTKARRQAYTQLPEVKARAKSRTDTPEYKAARAEHQRKLNATPEGKIRNRENSRARRETDKGRQQERVYQIRHHFGLEPDEYNAMLESQGNRCAICKVPFSTIWQDVACVDHCHDTTIVRGLLCRGCNIGIGHFHDDPKLLRRAARYLDQFMSIREAKLYKSH